MSRCSNVQLTAGYLPALGLLGVALCSKYWCGRAVSSKRLLSVVRKIMCCPLNYQVPSITYIVLPNYSSQISRQYQAPYESELVSNVYKARGVDDLQV